MFLSGDTSDCARSIKGSFMISQIDYLSCHSTDSVIPLKGSWNTYLTRENLPVALNFFDLRERTLHFYFYTGFSMPYHYGILKHLRVWIRQCACICSVVLWAVWIDVGHHISMYRKWGGCQEMRHFVSSWKKPCLLVNLHICDAAMCQWLAENALPNFCDKKNIIGKK